MTFTQFRTRTNQRTRIADLIEDEIATIGLNTVMRYVPDTTADWELPIGFVTNVNETHRYTQNLKNLERVIPWGFRILYAEVGLGWNTDHQQKMDNLIDDIIAILFANKVLSSSGLALDGVQTAGIAGVRIDTPYAFPTGQNRKFYHAAEIIVAVTYSQLCQEY